MISTFFIIMAVLFALSVPIAASLGLCSTWAVMESGLNLAVVGQKLFGGLNNFTLLAIPFFVFAGQIMSTGGISKRMIRFANTMVGNSYGGFAIVTIVACMFFAAVSGSGAATSAAIGAIMIPAMVERNYDVRFAACTTATAAELGVIIPPSVSMILFCSATNASIGDMFIAGVLPGILIGLSLILVARFYCKKRGWLGDRKYSAKEKWDSFKDAILALLMPLIILGGIYSGIFTATESAVVASAYAVIISTLVYREVSFKKLLKCFADSALTVGMVMVILSAANLFAFILTVNNIPSMVANWFVGLGGGKIVFIIAVNLLLFVVGMFFDGAPAMLILAPILLPAANAVGIETLHFGIMMVCNLALGMITPPFGVNLYVVAAIADIKFESMIRYILMYVVVVWIDLLIISFVPQITMLLPSLMG